MNPFAIVFFLLFYLVSSQTTAYYGYMCYDGAFALNGSYCPNKNNGCPFFAPYRCSNGACVLNFKSCPRVQCGENEVVCNDGSCHKSEEDCANINVFGCPGSLIRCINGECKKSCYWVDNACTAAGAITCPTGQCAVGENENCMILPEEIYEYCDQIAKQYDATGMLKLKPCADGTCVHAAGVCPVLNRDAVNSMYPCGDKTYRNSTAYCPTPCPAGLKRCPNGLCTKDHCAFQRTVTVVGLERPSACPSGQTMCLGKCTSRNCARRNPVPLYQCLDEKSYAHTPFAPLSNGETTACVPIIKCPMDSPVLCPGLSCAVSSQKCPPSVCSAYRCTNGKCVDDLSKCLLDDYICPEDIPVLCASGHCVRTTQECKNAVVNLLNKDSACTWPTLFKCYDGSCASSPNNCLSVAMECDPKTKPYRCPNGKCAESLNKCDQFTADCPYGQILCVDGSCQETCPPLNGCPIEKPYQCPNGACGVSMAECIGRSGCPSSRPFQCTSMACMEQPDQCETPAWSLKPMDLMITMHATLPSSFEVCKDATSKVCTKVYIPSGTQLCSDRNCYNTVIIRPVADSVLRKLWPMLESSTENYMREKVHSGYEGVDGMTIVKSPVVNVSGLNGGYIFTNPIRLELYTDIQISSEYCLGLASIPSNSWTCEQRLQPSSSNLFWIRTTGIYAIIYYPEYYEIKEEVTCRWPCNHPRLYVLSVIGCMILVIFIVVSLWAVSNSKGRSKLARARVVTSQKTLAEISTGKTGRLFKIEQNSQEGIKRKLEFENIAESDEKEAYRSGLR